jgi:predicted DNA-binding transcriptional regulator AlpA
MPFLMIKEVCRRSSFKRSTVYRMSKKGRMPKLHKLGDGPRGRVGMREDEYLLWESDPSAYRRSPDGEAKPGDEGNPS